MHVCVHIHSHIHLRGGLLLCGKHTHSFVLSSNNLTWRNLLSKSVLCRLLRALTSPFTRSYVVDVVCNPSQHVTLRVYFPRCLGHRVPIHLPLHPSLPLTCTRINLQLFPQLYVSIVLASSPRISRSPCHFPRWQNPIYSQANYAPPATCVLRT